RSMKWSLTLILTLFVAVSAIAAGPDDQYVAIYDLIQQGDSFSKTQPAVAAGKYQEAQTQLKALQNVAPNWNKEVVDYRLNYLADKLQELGKYVSAQPADAPAKTATPAKPTPQSLEQQLAGLQQQVEQLGADKSKLEAKLKEALSAQPAAVDPQELAKANEKINALTKERDLLAATLEQQKQNVNKSTADAEVAALREQLAAAKKDNAALQVQIAQLRNARATAPQVTPAESEQMSALSRERDDLKKQIDGLTKELADAEAKRDEDVLAAKGDVEKIRTELKDAQQKLQQWNETSHVPDTSKQAIHDLKQQVLKLSDRIAVYEAKPIARTPEEIALFKKSEQQPTPVAKVVHSVKDLPADGRAAMADGQRLYAAKDFAGAEAKFRDALKTDPNNIFVIAHIANTQMTAEKYDACEETLKQGLAVDADDAACLYILGKLRLRQDKVDEALDALAHSARVNPTNAMTENALGNALSRKGMRAPAETALRKAIQIEPDFADAHHNLALVYATDNPPSVELAKWHYKKATEAGYPKDAELEKLLK
ncbi:MAG: nrfG, partial [Verrucomicrobiales bacterium]|nr:nrfG [Verrucomicrobiales bacterium]